jgi:hypothetical protein
MEATTDLNTSFYFHTPEFGGDGCLWLLAPQRIDVPGDRADQNGPVDLAEDNELAERRAGRWATKSGQR